MHPAVALGESHVRSDSWRRRLIFIAAGPPADDPVPSMNYLDDGKLVAAMAATLAQLRAIAVRSSGRCLHGRYSGKGDVNSSLDRAAGEEASSHGVPAPNTAQTLKWKTVPFGVENRAAKIR
jgi:hypothetical protein